MPHVVEFAVLGPLEVTIDGRAVAVPGARQRALLAALVMRRGTVVHTDRLVDDVFGDDPPGNARNTVQTCVARLRQALGPAAGAVVTRPPGYLLDVPDDAIDAQRFATLVTSCESLPDAVAVAAIDEALELWRGAAYAEFADGFANGEAQRLEELRLAAAEQRAALLLRLDRATDAIASLEALVAQEPWRERPVELLATSLARFGRTADALATVRRFCDRLRDDLGLDPSPRLVALEQQVLRGQLAARWTQRRPLPARNTSFVGRRQEMADAARMLAPGRVVTLVGPGGVGKTRLAQEVAAGEDVTWWLDLAALSDDAVLPHALLDAVGLDVQPVASHADVVRSWLRSVSGLLVLDNCEHLLAGTARLIGDLLAVPSEVCLLATSRQRIDIDGEYVLAVAPLRVSQQRAGDVGGPAVELFVDRARAALPGYVPDPAAMEKIGLICRGLDGLPLSIELAAARVGTLTVDDLADRLDARFELLRRGFSVGRAADQRHDTLTGVVDWSYDLLTDDERTLFLRLSVFAASFDIATAEAIVADSVVPARRVTDLVARLADRSMLTLPEPGGVGRYRMLETLRDYASSRLSLQATAEIRQRHAEYFVELAERAESGLCGSEEAAWARRIETSLDDLRAAWRWARDTGEHDLAVRVAAALTWYGYWRLRSDVLDWGTSVVRVVPSHPRLPAAYAAAAHAAWFSGRIDEARALAQQGIVRAGGDDAPAAAEVLYALGDVELLGSHPDRAAVAYRKYATLSKTTGDAAGFALGSANMALSAAYSGADARQSAEQAVEAAVVAANPTVLAFARFVEGEALGDHKPERAADALRQAREASEEVGNPFVAGIALNAAVALAGRHGEPGEAFARFRHAVEHWRATGNRTLIVTTLRNLVILLARTGRDEPAVDLAATLASSAHARSYGIEAERIATALAAVRMRLGDAAYGRAWSAGTRKTLDAATASAAALLAELS